MLNDFLIIIILFLYIDVTNDENFANSTTISSDDGKIIAKKKNRTEFMGMLKGSIDDDLVITRNLIIGKYLVYIYNNYLFVILY